ncbi:MAG: hypothetical protein L3J17_12390 [Candidatus Jettenia sp.]|nr:MAG: hypothetical protein L3J17_12390 [Candidatus Jettenia sp.]
MLAKNGKDNLSLFRYCLNLFCCNGNKALFTVTGMDEGEKSFLGGLLSCGYCFSHWIACVLVALYRPRLFESWCLLNYFFTALIIAWLAAFQWVLMCWLMDRAGK